MANATCQTQDFIVDRGNPVAAFDVDLSNDAIGGLGSPLGSSTSSILEVPLAQGGGQATSAFALGFVRTHPEACQHRRTARLPPWDFSIEL